MTNSMIEYKTTFENTQNLPMVVGIGHGESADFIATVTDNGVEVDLTGFTARAIYQPSSKFGTDDWYECSCEISGNKAIAHWTNLNDNGDNSVVLWIRFEKDAKACYPCLYKLRLFATPGFQPSTITPIPETIDFSEYTLLNAPWVPLAGNETITGDLTMDECDLIHKTTKSVTYKNIRLTNDTGELYGEYIYLSYDATYAPNLLLTESDDVPIHIKTTLIETGTEVEFDAVLTNPTYWDAYSEFAVRWDMYRDNVQIGNAIFRKLANVEYPHTSSGMVNGEVWILGEYIADTIVPNVEVNQNYIYDLTQFRKEMVNLITDAYGASYIKSEIGSSYITQNKWKFSAETGHLYYLDRASYNPLDVEIDIPNASGNKALDFVLYIHNGGSNSLVVHLSNNWKYAYESAVEQPATIFNVSAGDTVRFNFKETGLEYNSHPLMFIEKMAIVPLNY